MNILDERFKGILMLYFRKSVNVGPFRFNFSKSGIGFSVGVKGCRIGTGPRGSYLHMGTNGIYYRKNLSDETMSKNMSLSIPLSTNVEESHSMQSSILQMENTPAIELENLLGYQSFACANELNKCVKYIEKIENFYSEKYLPKLQAKGNEIEYKAKSMIRKSFDDFQKYAIPFYCIGCVAMSCIFFSLLPKELQMDSILPFLFSFGFIAFIVYKIHAYIARESIIENVKSKIQPQIDAFILNYQNIEAEYKEKIAKCAIKYNFTKKEIDILEQIEHIWDDTLLSDPVSLQPHLGARIDVSSQKQQKIFVCDKKILWGKALPPCCQLNHKVMSINAGRRALFFFPNFILVFEDSIRFYAVPYTKIKLEMIEHIVQVDECLEKYEIVKEVWEHERVNGGPDRRFKENKCSYWVKFYGLQFTRNKPITEPMFFGDQQSATYLYQHMSQLIHLCAFGNAKF